jgi:hypothetical protein
MLLASLDKWSGMRRIHYLSLFIWIAVGRIAIIIPGGLKKCLAS